MKSKSAKSISGIFIKFILFCNSLFALMLVLALLSTKVNPEKSSIPALLGLAYPILVYINAAFVILWILLRRKWFLISLIAIVSGFSMIPKYFQINFSGNSIPENTETFSIVSYNIQSFNTFYHHESQEYLDSLATFLKELQPDIICFQEFYNDLEMEEDITSFLERTLELPHQHINSRLTRWERYEFGLAIFSRFPIINSGRILNANYEDELYTTNYAIFSDIVIFEDTFRVYNVHLESIKISEEDDLFPMLDQDLPGNIGNESRKLLSKLRLAYVFRANQIEPIREHMDNSIYPIILCGDFNDTPASWAYARMTEGLNDGFVKAGKGTGKTYNGRYPSFRIDYILAHPKVRFHIYKTPQVEFSDHFPVYSVCSVNKKEK